MRTNIPNHDPRCEAWPLKEIAEKNGWELPDDKFDGTIEFMKCNDHCPRLAAAIEHGHELADKYGWEATDG